MGGATRLNLLLDTHIWLWFVIDPKRLGRNTFKALKDEQNELWLSPISTREALALHQKGRIDLQGDLGAWVSHATKGIKEAVLTHEIMFAARQLPLHQDPSDRMLAAAALVLELTLVISPQAVTRIAKHPHHGKPLRYSE
jgi:PIN domain nuclease of toxin-antitoxin system